MRPLTAISPSNEREASAARVLSGTAMKIQTAAKVRAPNAAKTPRQPSAGSSAWTGVVVSALPSAPIAMAMPVSWARRLNSNQSACALMTAMSPAEMPTPSRMRPAASPANPGDSAKIMKPSAARVMSTACTRLGP